MAQPRYWTAAKTKRGEENRAACHVERQGFKFYLPLTYEPTKSGLSERRTFLFPGFIFVKLKAGWPVLSSTRGISALMMNCNMPAHVRESEIAWLMSLENEKGVVRLD